jgi:hypothetical protein
MIMNCLPPISAIVIMLVSSRSQPKPAANNSDDGLARSQAEVSPSDPERSFFARQKIRRYRVCGECGNLISDELTAVISGSVMTVLSS